jgi:ATP synthase protein I
MQSVSGHRGDLSQDSLKAGVHRSGVAEKVSESRMLDDVASRRTRQMYQALSASSVGLELGISVLIGLLGGIWLDDKLGTEPWMMLLCLVVGLIAGFRGVLRAVDRSDRAAAREASIRG